MEGTERSVVVGGTQKTGARNPRRVLAEAGA